MKELGAYAKRITRSEKSIGETIRLFRQQQGLTRNAMCKYTGMNYTTICRIEEEGRTTTATLFDLADAFKYEIVIQFVPRAEIIDVKAELDVLPDEPKLNEDSLDDTYQDGARYTD